MAQRLGNFNLQRVWHWLCQLSSGALQANWHGLVQLDMDLHLADGIVCPRVFCLLGPQIKYENSHNRQKHSLVQVELCCLSITIRSIIIIIFLVVITGIGNNEEALRATCGRCLGSGCPAWVLPSVLRRHPTCCQRRLKYFCSFIFRHLSGNRGSGKKW